MSRFAPLMLLSLLAATACAAPPAATLPPETATRTPTELPPVTADTQPPAEAAATAVPATPAPEMADADAYPWWNQAVFYEVFVRSFADSAEGELACDGTGDINGLIERLDYLNDGDPTTTDDLGVTGIWLMPIMESASYHGYDVVDYLAVEQDYGTNEDFRRLIDEAHARGIRVIVDLVMNHTSNEHPWFRESIGSNSPYHDYYVWTDDPPSYNGPWNQDVWHGFGRNAYYGLFWSGMPDLNYRNPDVTAEMREIVRFWLEDMGVDGFRLDAVKYLVEEGEIFDPASSDRRRLENTASNAAWLRDFYTHYKSVDPDALTVGEVWDETDVVLSYIGDQMDLAFQFDLAQSIVDSVNDGDRLLVASNNTNSFNAFPPLQYATFITNHDQDRVINQFGGNVDKARAAAGILLTSPGVPFVYYGEEIGMQGAKPDERIRTPMQWASDDNVGFSACSTWQRPYNDSDVVNVTAQSDDPNSLLSHYRSLIHLRSANPALMVGDLLPVKADERAVYPFIRQSASQTVLVIVNLSDQVIEDYALELDESSLSNLREGRLLYPASGPLSTPDLQPDGGFDGYAPVARLAPYTTYVIQLAP